MSDERRNTLPDDLLLDLEDTADFRETLAHVIGKSPEKLSYDEQTLSDLEDLEIISMLGKGGMGVVYRALQRSLKREVAVKLLHRREQWSTEQRERFHQEVLLAASLSHPNIVHIHWVRQTPDLFYFVMELVHGLSLADLLSTRSLTLKEVQLVFSQVCDGLSHAHSKGVIHRDLKPGNILVETSSPGKKWSADNPVKERLKRAVLVDFGLAARTGDTSTTQTGLLLGTPAYVSPEQAKGEKTDHRSDLYSLGVMLFEVLTGRVPFFAPTPLAMAVQHATTPPPDPRELIPSLPTRLAELVNALLEKDPSKRPDSSRTVRGRLIQSLQDRASGRASNLTPAAGIGLTRAHLTVLTVDLVGFTISANDQALSRTNFELETWTALVEKAVSTFSGALVEQEAARISAVFGEPEKTKDHQKEAIGAVRQLVHAMRDFNRTHGRQQEFTAGLESGTVFFGNIGAAARPVYFGRPVEVSKKLSLLRNCGIGIVGRRLGDELDGIPLEILIGVTEDLGTASRVLPAYFEPSK